MPLAHAMWIHGHSLRIENPDNLESTRRHGSAITLIGRANRSSWFHFAIPTPVYVDDKRINLDSVMLRFRTSGAVITNVHIYDGERKFAPEHNGLNYTSADYRFERFSITDINPHPRWGIGLSFRVEFEGAVTERRIDVSSAGGDFV
jgi:hypothetical protein